MRHKLSTEHPKKFFFCLLWLKWEFGWLLCKRVWVRKLTGPKEPLWSNVIRCTQILCVSQLSVQGCMKMRHHIFHYDSSLRKAAKFYSISHTAWRCPNNIFTGFSRKKCVKSMKRKLESEVTWNRHLKLLILLRLVQKTSSHWQRAGGPLLGCLWWHLHLVITNQRNNNQLLSRRWPCVHWKTTNKSPDNKEP